ncbi:carboxymuconolactone decarboxylase family protein [Desulfobacterota bacterium AH_259_B03_O07]|nr:carboxymuconolactone decarboxylase family protein [Desulfobacterota bacterium AH_259_B03_O07]
MNDMLPPSLQEFIKKYPEIWQAYENLGDKCHEVGPLDEKTRRLVNLGIAIGARLEGAVHSHTKRTLQAGISEDEILHVALLAITTIGFPSTIAAITWIRDILNSSK